MIFSTATIFYLLCAGLAGAELADDPCQAAREIRRFSFELDEDQDYDNQPDDWTRRRGKGFPHYVEARIDRTQGVHGRQSLHFAMNGAPASYYSPLIRVNHNRSYVLRARVRTESLQHNAAVVSLSVLDHKRRRTRRLLSQPISGTHAEWVSVHVGPVILDEDVTFLVIGCHVVQGDKSDIRGGMWFDDLWLGSLPRIKLVNNSGAPYHRPGDPISIATELMGLDPQAEYRLSLLLENDAGAVLEQKSITIAPATADPAQRAAGAPEGEAPDADADQGRVLAPRAAVASREPKPKPGAAQPPAPPQTASTHAATNAAANAVSNATASKATPDDLSLPRFVWELSSQPQGFYRARAILQRTGGQPLEKVMSFVVMDAATATERGEFGWSVASGPGDVTLPQLAELLEQAGVHWVKFPLWSASNVNARSGGNAISDFLDRLDEQHITPVGLLNDPPPQVTDKFARHWVGVSKIFTMPREFWYPSLEPIIARYSFRIRYWQLGGEEDGSFIGLQSLKPTIAAVKREFDRIGHDSQFGFHWDWTKPFPTPDEARHSFLSLDAESPVAAPTGSAPLVERLRQSASLGLPRWLVLQPLAKSKHAMVTRVTDLARRMIEAKIGSADAIFAADPFDPEHGLLERDGSPTELFLPWRTVALALSGATYLGQFEMPGHSPNAVFVRQNEVIFVTWNDQPTQEKLYLGEHASLTDLWGRRQTLENDPQTGAQVLQVGPIPLIVRGCSEPVARWRLAVQFEKGRLRSEYGAHEEAVLALNTFPQGVSGKAVLHMPPDWDVEPAHWTIQAAAQEKLRLPTLLTFPPDASLGKMRPRLDFEIAADRPYKFSVYLPYRLGLGDVELEVSSRRTADGQLEIEQRIVNNTAPLEVLSFNCSLFVPGQIRQKQVVTKLGAGDDKRFYHVPNADALRGKKLWLRAEQIDGRRVLNCHLALPE